MYGDLPIPTRNGYVFTGWYTENNGGEAVTENSIYSEVLANTLYAGWQKNKFTVTINPNEGTYEESTGETNYLLEYQAEKNIANPTRVGYTFKNWTVTGSDSSITNGIFKMGTENSSLTANWTINSYTLTVNPNGGTWNSSTSSQNFNMNYKTTKEIPNPTKDGHTFTGWEVTGENAELNSTTFAIGNGNATLKATWEANDYKYITKHYQQNVTASGYTLIDADTKEDTGKFGTQVTPPVKKYTGFTSPSPKTLTITSNELANLIEYQYARNKYNLTVNPNGGRYNNSTANTVTEMYYGASQTIENPTRAGYTFTNWSVSSGEIADKVFTMGTSAATLTANYSPNKYVLTFNANGGTVTQATQEVTYDSTYGTHPTPTHNNATFIGWFTSASGGEEITSSRRVTLTESLTLYAHWKIDATTKIMNLATTNTNQLRVDTHVATGQQTFATTEYRYYGSNPNNYIRFNNELWRIIGAMDVDDGTGKVEKRLKIIRANSIGKYSWDSSDFDTNSGFGINEWTQADLMTLLNSGAYYNRSTGTCYNSGDNATTSCDFTTTGLTTEAKEMIGNAKWYLGAVQEDWIEDEDEYGDIPGLGFTSSQFYDYERGTSSSKQCPNDGQDCSDTLSRKTSWVGKIGLIYPSDYGYSSDMKNCSSTALALYNRSCKNSNWIYKNSIDQFTISPAWVDYSNSDVNYIDTTGSVWQYLASSKNAVFPVAYLTYNIKIIDGIGTEQQPFILSK